MINYLKIYIEKKWTRNEKACGIGGTLLKDKCMSLKLAHLFCLPNSLGWISITKCCNRTKISRINLYIMSQYIIVIMCSTHTRKKMRFLKIVYKSSHTRSVCLNRNIMSWESRMIIKMLKNSLASHFYDEYLNSLKRVRGNVCFGSWYWRLQSMIYCFHCFWTYSRSQPQWLIALLNIPQ